MEASIKEAMDQRNKAGHLDTDEEEEDADYQGMGFAMFVSAYCEVRY